jgi:hypothetical protein
MRLFIAQDHAVVYWIGPCGCLLHRTMRLFIGQDHPVVYCMQTFIVCCRLLYVVVYCLFIVCGCLLLVYCMLSFILQSSLVSQNATHFFTRDIITGLTPM